MNASLLGGIPYIPCLSFKPFHSAVSEGLHTAVGISSKANDREDICLQTLFLFLVLPQTPCFPPRVPRFPLDPVFSTRPCVFQQTLCYPQPTFSTPWVFQTPHNPFPWPCVFHPAETAMILSAVLHKLLARKNTYFTMFGTYKLIKLVSSRKSKVKSQNPIFLLHGQ